VRSLVLACTYAEPLPEMDRRRAESLAQLGGTTGPGGEITIDPAKLDPMALFQHLMPLVFTPTFLSQQLPTLMQLFSGALQWGFSIEAILAQVGACTAHCTTDRLGQIKAPTLVITGDGDLLIPPAHSDVLARGIPGARMVTIPGGSHGFNFENAPDFNRAVLEFLAGA
jgi:pimeloyl-ACP methyl ester carboxylesterase